MRKHIKQMVNNCHIFDLVQAMSHVENDKLNLVVKSAKPLNCRTVASYSIILTTISEQTKQT